MISVVFAGQTDAEKRLVSWRQPTRENNQSSKFSDTSRQTKKKKRKKKKEKKIHTTEGRFHSLCLRTSLTASFLLSLTKCFFSPRLQHNNNNTKTPRLTPNAPTKQPNPTHNRRRRWPRLPRRWVRRLPRRCRLWRASSRAPSLSSSSRTCSISWARVTPSRRAWQACQRTRGKAVQVDIRLTLG